MNKFTTKIRHASPSILTGLSIAGVVGTTVMAVRATPKALQLIKDKKDELDTDHLKPMEVAQTTWKCYIPSILIGVGTITCIIGIGCMDKRNQVSLMSAYAMLNESYKQYRKSAKIVYGKMQMTKSMRKWRKMRWCLHTIGAIRSITWIWIQRASDYFFMIFPQRSISEPQWQRC